MDLQLKGKHVLITGSSKGIGLACAHVFLEEGARVSLVSRNPATLLEAAQALRAARQPVQSWRMSQRKKRLSAPPTACPWATSPGPTRLPTRWHFWRPTRPAMLRGRFCRWMGL